jgi:hypothetical protein
MKSTAWIWFVGCAVWLMDGMLSLHYRALQHAQLAFLLAMLFFAAAIITRQQRR